MHGQKNIKLYVQNVYEDIFSTFAKCVWNYMYVVGMSAHFEENIRSIQLFTINEEK